MATTSAFILSYIKFQDHHAILKVYSQDHGFDSYFIANIYNKKNKHKPLLSPLNQVKLLVQENQKGSLKSIKSMSLEQDYRVESSLYNNSILLFTADILSQILSKEGASAEIYQNIKAFVLSLAYGNQRAHLYLLIKLTQGLGISPLESPGLFLNVETALYEPIQSSKLHLPEHISQVWKFVINHQWPFDACPNCRNSDLLSAIFVYYQYHYPGFVEPKSYQIIKEMFS